MSESFMNGGSSQPYDVTNDMVKQPQPQNTNYPPAFRPLAPQQPPPGGLRPPNDVGPRAPAPRLQRSDSRGQLPGQLPPRGIAPNQQGQPQQIRPNLQPRIPQNGPPFQQPRPLAPNQQIRPQVPPGQLAPRPTGNLPIRPPQQQQPQLQQQQQGNVPPNNGNFKRIVTALQSGQLASTPEDSVLDTNQQPPPIFQQRPPQPGARPPGVFPQKNIPSGPVSLSPDLQTSSPTALSRQPSLVRKPSQDSFNISKMENISDRTPPAESGGISEVDDVTKSGSAKNRSYSISVPGAPPELTRPLSEDERRRSVAAFGSNLPGSDGKLPSSLAFIQERIASIEGKSSSQSSLNGSKENLNQNNSSTDKVKTGFDDDDDVVMPSRNVITPPKSNDTSKSPSPLPAQRNPPGTDTFSNISHSATPNKTQSPNLSSRSSVNGSQEDVSKVPSRPPSNIERPSSQLDGTPRPPSRSEGGLQRTSSRSSILGSQEDVHKVTSRPPSGQKKDSSMHSSREDLQKIPPRSPNTQAPTTNISKSGSREDIRSRPPSNLEREPPTAASPGLNVESRPLGKVSPESGVRPVTLEPKTPDSLASTNGKDITSPETDIDLSSSPAPSKARTPISESSRRSGASSRSRSRAGNSDTEEVSKSGRSSVSKNRVRSSRSNKEGDNDSGVDESTQGNDCANGDLSSPRKSSKIPKHSASSPTKTTPSKMKPPKTPKTPDPDASKEVPLIKKVPMNKIQVGAAPSPNLKVVRSKIGSLDNASYRPGGGHVRIETKKLDFAKVQPKIAAKNDTYTPGGGDKKITQVKLKWEAKPKVGSLDKVTHKPGGGDKKIETVKLDFKDKAKPKVASKDNIKHQPAGGDVKIDTKKLEFKAQSKIGSLDNVKHRPGGGDKKIFDDKDYLKQMGGAGELHRSVSGNQKRKKKVNIDPSAVLMSTRPHSVGCPRRNKRYFGVIHESIDEEDYDDDTSLSISDNSSKNHNTKNISEVKKMKLLKEIAEQQYQSLPSLKTDDDYSSLGIIQPDIVPAERPNSRIGRRQKMINFKSKSADITKRKPFSLY